MCIHTQAVDFSQSEGAEKVLMGSLAHVSLADLAGMRERGLLNEVIGCITFLVLTRMAAHPIALKNLGPGT